MPYAMNGDVRIHYEIEGNGLPLMLHTGYLGGGRDWYTLGYVDALKDEYKLILPDPRGQGESGKPHTAEAYLPEHRVGDVITVLDALNIDRIDFWGYSMGGRIGFDVAAQHPERLSSVVLGGAQPFGTPPGENEFWRDLVRPGMAEAVAGNRELFGRFPSEILERWAATSDVEALLAARIVQPSLEPYLAAMNLPSLVYCGDRDTDHEGARRAAEVMPHATFVSLPGLDHPGAFIDSEAVLSHVRPFLNAKVDSPAGSST